jgi:hypothetical protein
MRSTGAAAAVLAASFVFALPGEAHKGITSKYTYNADVHSIFVSRCGRCHMDGGVGPMSLLKYEDAFPWAEALRAELLSPSTGEEFAKAAHRQISARELDIVLDWATGGTPEGDPGAAPPPAAIRNQWAASTPDLVIAMPQPFELPAGALEKTEEFVVPVAVAQPRAASQMDVLPGNPAIVRTVTISLRPRNGQLRPLGSWFPRQTPVPLALEPAARLEPGDELLVRVRYKKTWKLEGEPVTDRSAIGFYFAD